MNMRAIYHTTGLLQLELPMTVKVTRQSKGVYACELCFHPSHRRYEIELVNAKTKRAALKVIRARHPNIVKVRK